MPNFIDVHTHSLNSTHESVIVLDPRQNITIPTKKFCLGLHPWYIDSVNIENYKNKRDEAKNSSYFFALGEIGLDKNLSLSITHQYKVLSSEIRFAKENKLNIVVHVVGAFNEFIRLMNETNYAGNILIHGFSGNIQILTQLLNYKTYFSYGHSIFTSKKAQQSLLKTPLNKLFLETDDQKDYTIEQIYVECANQLNISIDQLKSQIESNYRSFQHQ